METNTDTGVKVGLSEQLAPGNRYPDQINRERPEPGQ